MSDEPAEHEVITESMRDNAEAVLRAAFADISKVLRVAQSDLGGVIEQGLRDAADRIAEKRAAEPSEEPPTEPPEAA